jgi:RNA polymerase sigma-70 factor (ECF subfamily)
MQHAAGSEFSALIEGEARRLAGFVLALVGDPERAEDLFQATCLELWRIRHTFRPGTDFGAWARTVARFQAMRHWRRARIERRIFSREAVDAIEAAYRAPDPDPVSDPQGGAVDPDAEARQALERCLEGLPEECRELLRERYAEAAPVREMALRRGASEAGLKMRLFRLRRKLGECVTSRLRQEAER